jgi:hypothetical protein
MRLTAGLMITVVCLAQTDTFKLPAVRTSIALEGQPVAISVWGSVSPARLSATVDLADPGTSHSYSGRATESLR